MEEGDGETMSGQLQHDGGEKGRVRRPWSLAMISTRPALITPTHEYVVPRSMPMAGAFDSAMVKDGGEKAAGGG